MPAPYTRGNPAPGFANLLLGDLARVWNTPHRYDAFLAYLVERHLMSITRFAVVLAVVVIGAQPLLFEIGLGPDANGAALVLAAVVSVIDLGWAYAISRADPWIGERWSLLFVTTTCVFMTKTSFLMTIPYLGLVQCTAFGAICGYVVFFHGPRVFAAVSCVAILAVVLVASREVYDGASILPVVALSATVLVIIGTVPVMRLLINSLMTADAEASHVDELTAALNRRGLDHEFRRLVRRGTREFTAFVLDLDRFKTINDTHGHATGDTVLISVARALDRVSSGAAVARLGGEEFVVVRPGTNEDSYEFGELLVHAVRTSSQPQVTASIGVAQVTIVDRDDEDAVLAELSSLVMTADKAMYRAKKNGGNRVHIGS